MWMGFSVQTVCGWFVFCLVILGTCCLWVSKITDGLILWVFFFSVVLARSLFLLTLHCICVSMACWFSASLFFIYKISNIWPKKNPNNLCWILIFNKNSSTSRLKQHKLRYDKQFLHNSFTVQKGFLLHVHSKLTKDILNIYHSTHGCEVIVNNLSQKRSNVTS
jgi:hypothetical protein